MNNEPLQPTPAPSQTPQQSPPPPLLNGINGAFGLALFAIGVSALFAILSMIGAYAVMGLMAFWIIAVVVSYVYGVMTVIYLILLPTIPLNPALKRKYIYKSCFCLLAFFAAVSITLLFWPMLDLAALGLLLLIWLIAVIYGSEWKKHYDPQQKVKVLPLVGLSLSVIASATPLMLAAFLGDVQGNLAQGLIAMSCFICFTPPSLIFNIKTIYQSLKQQDNVWVVAGIISIIQIMCLFVFLLAF